ncbi:MAG TPA: hypothetical protein VM261_20205 [Kofleriaceae bacterium]|nr:hypothetical protein [Kofleriaceae bacterium]
MKKNKGTRTSLGDISTNGLMLDVEQLGAAVGGMRCGEGWKEVSTATLNSNGGADTATDCTK